MPAVDANDSCNPTFRIDHGFCASSIRSAAQMAVGGSFSRRTSGAHRSSVCITPARTADAGAPVIRMKNTITGIPSAAASR